MTNQPPNPPIVKQMPIDFPANLEPLYANLAMIAHSPAEMVIDFARILPAVPKARVLTRIILSPLCAKLLYRALGENISKYEAQFGEIRVPEGPSLAEQLFRKPTGDGGPETPQEGGA